jgi:hypothetical protein
VTSPALALAVVAVRWWTRLYTWGLPEEVEARRRAEIESDLWELRHDPEEGDRVSPAVHVFTRLVAGLTDDVSWRVEQGAVAAAFRRAALVTAAAVFLLSTLWVVPLWSGEKPHQHCVIQQQIDAGRLNPSANCECEQRSSEPAPLSGRRDGAHMARLICRP